MSIYRIIILLAVVLALDGCEKNHEPQQQAALIFGMAHGFCAGDCAHFFQLKDGQLFRDVVERYTGSEPAFEVTPMSKDQYEIAKQLIQDFPDYLTNNPNTTFGCPDCADQGGYHLYYKSETAVSYWHIDTSLENVPAEIRDYMSKVRTVVDQLKN
ncbi:MAG TPA: hypothetical protein DIS90_13025 [Cytophagales bacterium]|nr:hypothetical protein [Cytophagales bacterium]